ncbi:MAG TPA: hypothetical protein VKR58_10515 [Aquella sp.]|nr:hypothetical protein [Aquella sp.]
MYRFGIKFCVIMLCYPLQYSWCWTCSYDNNQRIDALNDMAWHVVTVKASKSDLKDKITAITSHTTNKKKNLQADAEVVDLNCKKTTFTKVGDYCKYKIRMPYKTSYSFPLSASVSTYYRGEDDEEHGLCDEEQNEGINFYIDKNSFNMGLRFAMAEEYSLYPALHQSGEQDSAVLVVENSNIKEIKISEIKSIHAPWLALIHKDGDSDALYGSNKECSTKEDAWKINKLEHVGDSCLLIYDLKKAATVADNPSIEIKMLAGTTTYTESIKVDQVLKPMKLSIDPVEDIGMTQILNTELPINVLSLTNYYSTDEIKPVIQVHNIEGKLMDETMFVIQFVKTGCTPPYNDCEEGCHVSAKGARCYFYIVAKQKVLGPSRWGDYEAPPGKYFVQAVYNRISGEPVYSDPIYFQVLHPSVIESRIRERRKSGL